MLQRLVFTAGLALLFGCSSKPPGPPSAAATTATAQATDGQPAASPVVPSSQSAARATMPAGTRIRVRLGETLSSERNRAGDRFTAALAEPIVVGETTVLSKGTPFQGHVLTAGPSGRLKGRAVLALALDSFELQGKTYRIDTSSVSRVSAAHKKRNMLLIGGGSGLGAALGAVAGGGTGALIGAGAGAAAGTAGAAATGKKQVIIPVETPLVFSLKESITV